jgi:L-lysine exporter family protein LysE/ArgO
MSAFLPGFVLSLSFILAIGAQNAFVLRQGIRQEHVLLTVAVCCISEFVLIFTGVAGFGALTKALPWFGTAMRYGGAAFLLFYGAMSFKSAWVGADALSTQGQAGKSWKSVLVTCLALTWLNPHTHLDTVVLIGSISAQYGENRWMFGTGAFAASCLFFVLLGYGARMLAPVFANPRAWQVLDAIVGLTMWSIALGLIIYG